MTDWTVLVSQGRYKDVASALIAECEFDVMTLSENPRRAVENDITVIIRDQLKDGCGGGGYYQADPPTIYLHPSTARRNNFTLVHEVGHHLQQHHPELAFALLDMSPQARKLAEEKISNEVASQVLLPWAEEPLDARFVHPAQLMAGLFATSGASRSAALERVLGLLPEAAKWILVVADIEGMVQFARTSYSDAQPAKGSKQPGLRAVAEEAAEGPVKRRFHEGIRYSTGSELHDMQVEAVLDHEGRYVFAALTPEERFGTGRVISPVFDCANPACGRSFQANWVKRYCDKCHDPVCSWCSRCSCDPTLTTKYCQSCFTYWAPAEVAAGHHEC